MLEQIHMEHKSRAIWKSVFTKMLDIFGLVKNYRPNISRHSIKLLYLQ